MNICVYCGSQQGKNPAFKEIIQQVGKRLATDGHTIICGGVTSGLMGHLADSALAAGGKVIGVVETALLALGQVPHPNLTTLHLVESPRVRKEKMLILASSFLILPGGMGCLEELFDVWSEVRLNLHHKPIIIFNACGYYSGLMAVVDQMIEEGFIQPHYRDLLQVITSFEELEVILSSRPD